MRASHPSGISAFFNAVEQGHQDFADAFIDALELLGIRGERAGHLIEHRIGGGPPLLQDAYESDDGAAITFVAAACDRLGVPHEQKMAILRADGPDGDGPTLAKRSGNQEALAAFNKAVGN